MTLYDGKKPTFDAKGCKLVSDASVLIVLSEAFKSTNVRFFGEMALPAAQGWADAPTGSATIDLVDETVFGAVKQVVRHNDDVTNGSTSSKILLTAQHWQDINTFGASYGGVSRLDTVNGISGFFSGLQANAAENPLATGNRRYGLTFNDSDVAGNLRIASVGDFPTAVMDGTLGNPTLTFDEWFTWECVIPPGLGAAELYINGMLTTLVVSFNVNNGGLGTQVLISSGSTSGSNRIAFHDNFGVTIFEESAIKTLKASTMAADVAQINIPEGKRDYTIILPDGSPRPIGAALDLWANNLFGKINLTVQNPAMPTALYNGMRTYTIDVTVKKIFKGINTVNNDNIYRGFA